MSKTLNPIKKNLVKQSLMRGLSIRKALKEAGYADSTAHAKADSTDNRLVKVCIAEIMEGFNKAEITPELVLASLRKELKAPNAADRIRATELLGKYLAMFTERSQVTQTVTFTADEQQELIAIRSRLQGALVATG